MELLFILLKLAVGVTVPLDLLQKYITSLKQA